MKRGVGLIDRVAERVQAEPQGEVQRGRLHQCGDPPRRVHTSLPAWPNEATVCRGRWLGHQSPGMEDQTTTMYAKTIATTQSSVTPQPGTSRGGRPLLPG